MFPFLTYFGIVFNSGIYVITLIKDRQDGLRYLLNLAGLKSAPYIIGHTLANILLFWLNIFVLIIFSLLLGIELMYIIPGETLLIFLSFGVGFVPFTNLLGFMFKKAENSSRALFGLIYAITIVVSLLEFAFSVNNLNRREGDIVGYIFPPWEFVIAWSRAISNYINKIDRRGPYDDYTVW